MMARMLRVHLPQVTPIFSLHAQQVPAVQA